MTLKKESELYYSRPPQSYRCPLSGKLMEDPVTDLCAHNFDREAITAFLGNHHRCPISRKPLRTNDLVANHSLAEQVERWTFHRNHDGLLREIAGEESTSALSDDDEEFGDIVNQMEKGIQRKKRQGIHKTKFMYDEVPAELMLLPQEREMLATVRMKMDIARSVIRKKRCYRTTCTLVGLLTVFAGALITWRLLFSD